MRRLFALVLAIASMPAVVQARELDAGDVHWDIRDGVGEPGDVATGTNGAYAGAYELSVDGTAYAAPSASMLSAGGRQIDLPAMTLASGLTVARHVYVPATTLWARWVDVLTNPTASDITATVTISAAVTPGSALVTTSSGDTALTTGDTWLVTDDADGSGAPALAHLFRGTPGVIGVSAVSFAADRVTYTYSVVARAGGSAAILHLAVQAPSRAVAITTARTLATAPAEISVAVDGWESVVNWTTMHACGCVIGGDCVDAGAHHVAYPCLVCDTARDASDWSDEPSGTMCSRERCASAHAFAAGTCDATGTCVEPAPTACASMACTTDGSACEPVCTDTSCDPGMRCGPQMHCIPVLGIGGNCTSDVECDSGACSDGVCCEQACDGTCESCDLSGREGSCVPIPAGTDPAGDCGSNGSCDGHGACIARAPDAGPMTLADAGRDASTIDAGRLVGPAPASSCGCGVVGARTPGAALAWIALLGVLVSRRRRAW